MVQLHKNVYFFAPSSNYSNSEQDSVRERNWNMVDESI